jgi:hypothetical protein
MTKVSWLDKDRQLVPGTEIFRSERSFMLEAYTASFGQLLFRGNPGNSGDGNHHETTIDLLFSGVQAVNIQRHLHGLVIRCATTEEAEQITSALHDVDTGPGYGVFLLDSHGTTGYVISMGVGWKEKHPPPHSAQLLQYSRRLHDYMTHRTTVLGHRRLQHRIRSRSHPKAEP